MIDGLWLIVAGLWAVAVLVSQVEDVIDRVTGWVTGDDPEPTAVDEVHQLYLNDEIDEDDLEEQLEVLVDDRARTIRDLADDEHGIGDEISCRVAREFNTVGEFVAADVENLKVIDDVGQERAETLARVDR
ncbi:hypothetical protein SG26_14370 [Haloarcula sp. CBA1115]|uniref:hypothetical protein n=1 Tax=unclassified Haloarcula TaxID=2624677 RepID=UPI0005955436|nr:MULTISPECIES: hypothetical protein [unclassified Haloarcula]AJF26826.1 hypothetical protein SG26_14370 [Haloarcula sp. CBA1115]